MPPPKLKNRVILPTLAGLALTTAPLVKMKRIKKWPLGYKLSSVRLHIGCM
jgi:hypothetical protein